MATRGKGFLTKAIATSYDRHSCLREWLVSLGDRWRSPSSGSPHARRSPASMSGTSSCALRPSRSTACHESSSTQAVALTGRTPHPSTRPVSTLAMAREATPGSVDDCHRPGRRCNYQSCSWRRSSDWGLNGVLGPTRWAEVRQDGHCELRHRPIGWCRSSATGWHVTPFDEPSSRMTPTLSAEAAPMAQNKTTRIRIALVLNGGVSLAVWMSGVVHELDLICRASQRDAADFDESSDSAHFATWRRILQDHHIEIAV